MIEKDGVYEIEITDISTQGKGIGRVFGMVVFVPELVPGDKASVRITKIDKNFAHGFCEILVEPSKDRKPAPCPYFERCGGCQLQNISYEAQLRLKMKQLDDKLKRIYGGTASHQEMIVGMEHPWEYRNKAEFAVSAGRAVMRKDGSISNSEPVVVGFYDNTSRHIIDCENCMIQSPVAAKAAQALRDFIAASGISIYDEKNGKGRLRKMIVRIGAESREVMVVLVINGNKFKQKQLLADLMYDAIDELNFEAEVDSDSPKYELVSLQVNYNTGKSAAVPGKKTELIYGKSVITDTAADLKFEISPFSFYQVNSEQMIKLYDTVLEFAELTGTETVFDLYCGVGTIGMYMAKQAKYVWGIEAVHSAVLDANRNAMINGLVNIRFLEGKSEEKIFELLDGTAVGDAIDASSKFEDGKSFAITPDIVVLDPPRAGCKPELLDAVRRSAPQRIIYVSCDQGTLARDLKILSGLADSDENASSYEAPTVETPASYRIERIRQIDQFCQTLHVEVITLLSKLDSKRHISVELPIDEI